MDPAERLLVTWLSNFKKVDGVADLITVVGNRDSMKEDSTYKLKDISYNDNDDINTYLSSVFPSMTSWHALMSMYADRQAGYHCKSVFQFLEGVENSITKVIANPSERIGADNEGYVNINGHRIPTEIHADEKIHKEYVRALCETESFATAFRILSSMLSEKGMKLDANVITDIIKMVRKPSLVSDAAIPRITDLTMSVIKHLHDIEKNQSPVSASCDDSNRVENKLNRKNRSPDSCRVMNSLVTALCSRGGDFICLKLKLIAITSCIISATAIVLK